MNDQDAPCASDVEVIIRIRRNPGSGVSLHAPEASQVAFRGDWFYPGDTGALARDRVIAIIGRTRDIINIGGDKRSLRVIDGECGSRPEADTNTLRVGTRSPRGRGEESELSPGAKWPPKTAQRELSDWASYDERRNA